MKFSFMVFFFVVKLCSVVTICTATLILAIVLTPVVGTLIVTIFLRNNSLLSIESIVH